jgi:hypothetical protein
MAIVLQLIWQKPLLKAEKLGEDAITDILAVSFSATDYIGHGYGPNSIEQEDDFYRLDKDLGEFLNYLDTDWEGTIHSISFSRSWCGSCSIIYERK